jgi:hypothetical protein
MFADFESKWFQSFRRAVLKRERDLAYGFAEEALAVIGERLREPNCGEAERQAINAAIRSLNVIRSNSFLIAA